jgi:catechol 2,3-dioxygenase-like lactoylglutathione lyase family enzyme
MVEVMIPIFWVTDAAETAKWYRRLGFRIAGDHRFGPSFPLYMFLDRDGVQLHLSEHTGDARPGTLVYFWVEDVDAIAVEFGAEIKDQPWGREIKLTDPDGNRLRVATGSAEETG